MEEVVAVTAVIDFVGEKLALNDASQMKNEWWGTHRNIKKIEKNDKAEDTLVNCSDGCVTALWKSINSLRVCWGSCADPVAVDWLFPGCTCWFCVLCACCWDVKSSSEFTCGDIFGICSFIGWFWFDSFLCESRKICFVSAGLLFVTVTKWDDKICSHYESFKGTAE